MKLTIELLEEKIEECKRHENIFLRWITDSNTKKAMVRKEIQGISMSLKGFNNGISGCREKLSDYKNALRRLRGEK